jgi:hypothetical protein
MPRAVIPPIKPFSRLKTQPVLKIVIIIVNCNYNIYEIIRLIQRF